MIFIVPEWFLSVNSSLLLLFFCIHKNGSDAWISKEAAVALANEQRIHAILVHSSNGSLYLRPEYKGKKFRDLVC
jgi:hypothetical protein